MDKALQSLSNTADESLEQGDPRQALQLYREAVSLAEAANAQAALATLLGQMAVAHRRLGDVPAAIAANRRALEVARACGDDLNIARWSGNLGGLLYQCDDLDGAEAAFREAADAAARTGLPEQLAIATGHLAGMLGERGRFFEAAESMARARKSAAGNGKLLAIIDEQERGLLLRWSRSLNEAGRLREAREAIERALATFSEGTHSEDEVALRILLGAIAEKEGDAISASEEIVRAAEVSAAIGDSDGAKELREVARRMRG
jgi:tetratricopeptide (TPR) repeat protein